MVTINPSDSPIGSSVATANRGFIPAEATVPVLVRAQGIGWSGIIGGSLAAMGILVLAGALAYACELSTVTRTNADLTEPLYFGVIAAIWSWIAAAIAFFVGGIIASAVSRTYLATTGPLQGFLTWALVIVLTLVFAGMAIGPVQLGAGAMLLRYNLAAISQPSTPPAILPAWSAFICLGIGLVFSLIGGRVGAMTGKRHAEVHV